MPNPPHRFKPITYLSLCGWVLSLLLAGPIMAEPEGPQDLSDLLKPSTYTGKTGGKNSSNDIDPLEGLTKTQDLILQAMSLMGVDYKWGGNTPEDGLDCSGFVRYVFQQSLSFTLPRTAFEMAQVGKPIEKEELKPGDLVFFNTLKRKFSHVGIYLGDDRFIHSPRKGRSVEIVNMNQKYWQSRFNGARRYSEKSKP